MLSQLHDFFVVFFQEIGNFLAELIVPAFNACVSASFLAIAVILFRFIFKKTPKWFVVALWALVAIRLICPFSVESAWSLIPSAETLPQEIVFADSRHELPDASFGLVENPIYSDYFNSTVVIDNVDRFQTDALLFVYVWLLGSVLMLLYALISYIRLRYTVRTAIPSGKNIWLCDNVKSPFILGVFRPRIYLPSDMEENTAELVLRHERAHLKRRDHLWKPFGFVILSFYWFNPVLWLSYILLCRDIELACDEKVIKDMEASDKKAYSEALLSCSMPHRMIAACPVAFGEVGVKKRIKSVLNYKKPAFWVILIALVVSVVIAVCFMTDPKGQNGGTVTFDGVDEISELSFDMDKIMSSAYAYTVYNGISTTDDYFEVKSDDTFIFQELSSFFINELSLSRIVDGVVNPMHEPQTSGVVKISYDDYWSVSVIFHDDFSKMYMQKSSPDYFLRSKDYAVDNPSAVKKFFNEKLYLENSIVWEFNPASSARGNDRIMFLLDSKYKINGKVKGKGKITKLTNEDTGVDGIFWSPEIIEAPDNYNIEIPVIAEGKEKLLSLTISKVGKRNLSTYFALHSDNLVIGAYPEPYKFVLSEPEDANNLQWYYNPVYFATAYSQINFILPDGYTIASREINKSGENNIYDYNADADITEFKWSPDYNNIIEAGNVEMKVTAVKNEETVDYHFTLVPLSQDSKGGIYFEIKPENCKITRRKLGSYQLDGVVSKEEDEGVLFYELETGSFDKEYLTELKLTGKATVKNAEKTAQVYKCDNILSAIGGLWEFEKGFYSHPSGSELWDMRRYTIEFALDENRTCSINFDKNCSCMWLSDNKGAYTSTYKVKNPKTVKDFFEQEKFLDYTYVWEHNSSSDAYSLRYLGLTVEGEYESYTASCESGGLMTAEMKNGKIKGILQSEPGKTISCTKEDNLVWTPDTSGSERIHFEIRLSDGKTSDFYMYAVPIGKNYSGNTVYEITADYAKVTRVSQGDSVSFNFGQTYEITWLYNPMAGGTWWYETKYILPEGYEIKSAEATSGTVLVDDLYYNKSDEEKCVSWSPEVNGEADTEITVNATKKGKTVQFRIFLKYHGDYYDTGRKKFVISPINCKIKEKSTSIFLVEEK